MMKVNRIIILFIAILLIPKIASAQFTQGETMDKVIAVVGNEVILQSDILGQIAIMAQQNPSINPKDPAVYQQLLDAIINEKLLITKALEDSVVVTDDQIEARWQAFLQTLMQQFGSEERIEQVYKKSINRIKFEIRDDIRNKLLSSNLVQQVIMNVAITPKEVEEFYNNYRDSIQMVPTTVEIHHITKYVKANVDNKKKIFELARSIRDSLLKGGKFEDFAARYSDDAGTASSGGDLGWINKGKFFPEFESAAFALQINEISLPIETPFGYHLIQALDKKKESINTRHILFKIASTSDDKDKVIIFLDSLRQVATEKNNFAELAKLFSDDKDSKGFGGFLGRMPLEEMPANFRNQVQALKDNEISSPQPYNVDATKPAYHIIWKKRTIPTHKANFEDDFDYLNDMALDMKKMRVYNEFVEKLRKELYWEVKK